MTEYSYFWEGSAEGDAALAPYDSDDIDLFLKTMVLGDKQTEQGVVSRYLDALVPIKVSDSEITIGTGAAFVYGSLYKNDAPISIDTTTNGMYRIMLRKTWATNTVRLVVEYDIGSVPFPVQTPGDTWEILIADVYKPAGTATIHDFREFTFNDTRGVKYAHGSLGASDGVGASYLGFPFVNAVTLPMKMLCGTAQWTGDAAGSGSVVVNLPFSFSYCPVVIVTPYAPATVDTRFVIATAVCESPYNAFTIYWQPALSTLTEVKFFWMVLGKHVRGYA